MYRVWYSTESFADYIIDNTVLSEIDGVKKSIIYESDANKPTKFNTMPDHIRKILYLDACDLIVEKDNEPIFSIEISTEAGTGHNAFQRFARIAASVENNVPALYIYPEGVIIKRKKSKMVWDKINPLIFYALDSVMNIYNIPALLYYFPSDINDYPNNPEKSRNINNKGLRYDSNFIDYPGCPDAKDSSMQSMFNVIDEIIKTTENKGIHEAKKRLIANLVIRRQKRIMQEEFNKKSGGKSINEMSPITSVKYIKTEYILNYLSKYENDTYKIGELLRSREYTRVYQVNAKFRGDPYPGALAAIDYILCREGKTFEDRKDNLIIAFGKIDVFEEEKTISISNQNNSTINSFFKDVQNCSKHNLLTKDYKDLKSKDIPRYLMQVRYGSTYSKVKHIRVYSYFADAILFPDGSLWRDA